MALGGGPLAGDFVLAGLPLVAAAGGGIGGWLAGGAAVLAASAGGGGGGGTTGVGVTPSGQKGNLTHDAVNDTGVFDNDSYTKNNKPQLTVNAESGAKVIVSINGKDYTATETSTKGTYIVNVTDVLPDGVYTPVIKVTNRTGTSSANGEAFTVDISAKENQDGGESPTKIDDENNTKSTVLIKISSVHDGLNSTDTSNGSKDTGSSKTDFITVDGTLSFSGKVEGFIPNGDVVHVQVLNAANKAIIDKYVTLDSNNVWAINNQANTLIVGEYTIKASIEDKAGNLVKAAVDQPLTVVDPNTPTLVVRGETVSVQENGTLAKSVAEGVLVNDGDTSATLITVTKVGKNNANTNVTSSTFTTITGEHGQLDMFSDGHYEYRETDDTLAEGDVVVDSFTYEVGAFVESSVTPMRSKSGVLNISVTGKNDGAVMNLEQANVLVKINGTTTFENLGKAIEINDLDQGQAVIQGVAKSDVTYADGSLGSLKLIGNNTNNYGFSYSQYTGSPGVSHPAPVVQADTDQHDLFSLTSKDGTDNKTLDFVLTGSGSITKQVFNLSPLGNEHSITGLKVAGSSNNSITDVLVLHGATTADQQTTFDFSSSANTTFTNIEKIEIQGSGPNVIKLSLANLTQGDTGANQKQTLRIDGDANDTLSFQSVINKVDKGLTSDSLYHCYGFGTDELLVQATITNITFTS
jgi:VCBS repeat-containing protein